MALKTIGIIGNPKKDEAPPLAGRLIAILSEQNLDVRLAPEIAERVPATEHARPVAAIADLAGTDMILVLGGDGTLLHAIRELDGAGVPLFGINVGSLGFLTEIAAVDVESAISDVLAGRYTVIDRPILNGEIKDRRGNSERRLLALNDIVVDEGSPTRRAVRLRMTLGGQEVGTFTGDGVVVATPAGSTAYNLSAGGPVIGPQVPALVATPICPHTMSVRPIVYPDTETLLVEDVRPGLQIKVTADGQVYHPVPEGGLVSIALDPERRARFVTLQRRGYYDILRTRLRWGSGGKEN